LDLVDTKPYPMTGVNLTYTPIGSVAKVVHFVLDGEEIGTIPTSVSGIPQPYTIPVQTHGAHYLEAFITANLDKNTVTSNKEVRDIIWYDADNHTEPVIGARV
jgi:hypothetical protein